MTCVSRSTVIRSGPIMMHVNVNMILFRQGNTTIYAKKTAQELWAMLQEVAAWWEGKARIPWICCSTGSSTFPGGSPLDSTVQG